jgi:hypothetical protein
MPNDAYFLSATNPIATTAQRDAEDLAMRLIQRPELQKARGTATFLWREGMRYPAADQMDLFERTIGEYVFHYALRAAASDPCDPHAIRFMAPAHHWFGRDVPGSRWAGDSPDFVYRMIPIEHGGRFEIHVRPTCANPGSSHYAQMSDSTSAPSILNLLDVVDYPLDANGELIITVDDSPAQGRPHHIQTLPGAQQIWVRDALGDWNTQTCNKLTIKRLDTPKRGPLSEEELAARAAKALVDGVYYIYWCIMTCITLPHNEMTVPMSSAGFGGMATQYTAKVNLNLAPDEAYVVHANDAGAKFRNFCPSDKFMLSLEYAERLGHINMAQMAPDEDGLFTYVVSHRDPGVHNWIDTGGLGQIIIGQRWQAFGPGGPTEEPAISGRLVKFADLERELGAGVQRVDAAGRAAQLAQRLAGYQARFVDC